MPQMNKGGKYVFGISEIKDDGTVRFPSEAVTEYGIASEGRVYLFTGSKFDRRLLRDEKGTSSSVKARTYSHRNPLPFELHLKAGGVCEV